MQTLSPLPDASAIRAIGNALGALLLLALLFLAIATADVAHQRGHRPFWWFLVGLLLGPLGLHAALVVPVRQRELDERAWRRQELKRCVACQEFVPMAARRCRHCGEALVVPDVHAARSSA